MTADRWTANDVEAGDGVRCCADCCDLYATWLLDYDPDRPHLWGGFAACADHSEHRAQVLEVADGRCEPDQQCEGRWATTWHATGRSYAHRCWLEQGHEGPHVCSCRDVLQAVTGHAGIGGTDDQ